MRTAAENAEKHKVADRLKLQISDVFAAVDDEKYHLIASNPPYIAAREIENLQPEVRDYEPPNALTDGKDGFSIIEKIIADAPKFLKPRGFLLLEIGYGQAAETAAMFDGKLWETVEILPDFQAIPRIVRARRRF